MSEDIRIRGALREGSNRTPFYHPMPIEEFSEFWLWLRQFPIDQYQVPTDDSQAAAKWKKTLEVDIVLDAEERWRTKSSWTRPASAQSWVPRLEERLHAIAIEQAALARARVAVGSPDSLTSSPAFPGGTMMRTPMSGAAVDSL